MFEKTPLLAKGGEVEKGERRVVTSFDLLFKHPLKTVLGVPSQNSRRCGVVQVRHDPG